MGFLLSGLLTKPGEVQAAAISHGPSDQIAIIQINSR